MITQKHCLLCGGEVGLVFSSIARMNKDYAVFTCQECGLGKTFPFPTKEEMNRLYSDDVYRVGGVRFIPIIEKIIRSLRKVRLKAIQKFCKKGRLLDVGCGGGQFLAMMQEAGWKGVGIEVNEAMASQARKIPGLEIYGGTLEEARLAPESFDVVTLYHVLEHIPEPIAIFKECFRLLKPGGLLVVAVPNWASWQSRFAREDWFHLDIPHHLHHFSTNNLNRLFKENGFQVMRRKHFSLEQNPYGWLQSLLNHWDLGHNFLYNFLKTRKLRGAFSWKLGMTVFLLPFLAPLSFLLAIFESLMGYGGTIELFGVKKGGNL